MDETTRPLTAKRQAFCREYIIDLNASAAARRAGYSTRTAEQQGYQLLQHSSVQTGIQSLMDERIERTAVDADYVVQHLKHEVENARSDSARVAALGLLARHLGMLTDKVQTEDVTQGFRIVCGDVPLLEHDGDEANVSKA